MVEPAELIRTELQLSRQEVDDVLNDPNHTPEDVVNLFERDFGRELDGDVGVFEGYSLREHTAMVLGQYHTYFREKGLPRGLAQNVFEVTLALHDIGKPLAVAEGDKSLQHEYTKPMLVSSLSLLGFSVEEVKTAGALVDGDPIGKALIAGDAGSMRAAEVRGMADESDLPVRDFWELLKVFYMIDASSYTADAGGLPSLDWLFVFDREAGNLEFAPRTAAIVDDLERQVIH